MTEERQTPGTPPPSLSDWNRLADQMAPNLTLWMVVSGIAAGVMLCLAPIESSVSILASIAAVLLAPLVLCFGWFTGVSMFAASCETFRKGCRGAPLQYIVPVLVVALVGLGLLGGRYWWLFSIALAILGHRKGTRRAWWSAVACVAFVLREGMGIMPLAATDEDALAMAMDSINKEIGRGPNKL